MTSSGLYVLMAGTELQANAEEGVVYKVFFCGTLLSQSMVPFLIEKKKG
jgi:hypothetical protein